MSWTWFQIHILITFLSVSLAYHEPVILFGSFLLYQYNRNHYFATQQNSEVIFNEAYVGVLKVLRFHQPDYVKTNEENYPKSMELFNSKSAFVDRRKFLEFDMKKAEEITQDVYLNGTNIERDAIIYTMFKNMEKEYGRNSVLGIIIGPESHEHSSEIIVNNAEIRMHFWTPPVFRLPDKLRFHDKFAKLIGVHPDNNTIQTYELLGVENVETIDPDALVHMLIATFYTSESDFKVRLRFFFGLEDARSKWTLTLISTEWGNVYPTEEGPSAPRYFSYLCDETTIFRNNGIELEFGKMQIQPYMHDAPEFNSIGNQCNIWWSSNYWVLLLGLEIIMAAAAVFVFFWTKNHKNYRIVVSELKKNSEPK